MVAPVIITGIIAAIAEAFKAWMEVRRVKADGKIKVTEARIQAEVTKIEKEAQMDLSATEGMNFSWKDEWFVVLLSMPFIGSFIPQLQPYVRDGFLFLRDCTPDWYQWAFLGAIVASFGLRTWTGWKKP